MKRTALALAVAAIMGSASMALAQSGAGWYTGIRGGLNALTDANNKGTGGSTLDATSNYQAGYGVLGFFGYDFGLIRAEFEGGHRRNSVDKLTVRNDNGIPAAAGSAAQSSTTPSASGSTEALTLLGNVYYDFNTDTAWEPYIGAGLGAARVKMNSLAGNGVRYSDSSDWRLAYQAMAGVAYWFSNNFALTADYRFLGTADPRLSDARSQSFDSEYMSHGFMLGATFRFGAPPPPPPAPAPAAAPAPAPAPAPAVPPPAPAPAAPKKFTVFFDFDKSDITAQAQRIINDAAAEWKRTGTARISATGHTDRAGTDRYNQRLSERRAAAVKDALVRQGVPANNIVTIGRGESQELVPTADGVREPQNRRVEIVF